MKSRTGVSSTSFLMRSCVAEERPISSSDMRRGEMEGLIDSGVDLARADLPVGATKAVEKDTEEMMAVRKSRRFMVGVSFYVPI
mmetsp:Transcript_732/g.1532  ORF Transcript_732/g.1532 Transcript_732/m.1532 type:complete len:84 (-) Transcript_732:49-300(-)